ncbi:flippase-like domain-containing protein [Candidatus Micrarchaeota archaeon]|nr:flippase-like domain-containing protein [Candidatus Micrarchaeota archaeon]
MNFRLEAKNVLFLAAFAIVAYALLKVLDAEKHLGEINATFAIGAIVLYFASILLWNLAWGIMAGMNWKESIKAAFYSQIGTITPFAVGADYLRGRYAKGRKGKFTDGLAASFASKFYKILISLAFSVVAVGIILSKYEHLRYSIVLSLAIPAGLLFVLYFFTKNYGAKLLAKFSMQKVSEKNAKEFSKSLSEMVGKPKIEVLGLLSFSLAFEFIAFLLSFFAFGVNLANFEGYLVFVILFYSSKINLIPQGIGITEIAGIIVLRDTAALSLVAAALLLWGIVRIWAPLLISGAYILAMKKRI